VKIYGIEIYKYIGYKKERRNVRKISQMDVKIRLQDSIYDKERNKKIEGKNGKNGKYKNLKRLERIFIFIKFTIITLIKNYNKK